MSTFFLSGSEDEQRALDMATAPLAPQSVNLLDPVGAFPALARGAANATYQAHDLLMTNVENWAANTRADLLVRDRMVQELAERGRAAPRGLELNPAERAIAMPLTEYLLSGESRTERRARINRYRPQPEDAVSSQILNSVGNVLTLAAASGGNIPAAAAITGVVMGEDSRTRLIEEGVAPEQAAIGGAMEGAFMGLGVLMPASLPFRGWLARMASGAALNTGFGMMFRGGMGAYLEHEGYPELAERYQAFDQTAIAIDLVLGAAFGLLPNEHAPNRAPVAAGEQSRGGATTPAPAGEVWLSAARALNRRGNLDMAYAHALIAERRGVPGAAEMLRDLEAEGGPGLADRGRQLADALASRGNYQPSSKVRAAALHQLNVLQRDVLGAPGIPATRQAERAHQAMASHAEAQANHDEAIGVQAIYEQAIAMRRPAPRLLSLMDFVRRQGETRDANGRLVNKGGIRDDRGDVAAQIDDGARGFAALISPTGRALDDIALAAWEAGYFPDHVERPSIRELIDALREDAGGNPRYPVDDEGAVAAESRAAFEQEFEERGIDVFAPDDVLRARIREVYAPDRFIPWPEARPEHDAMLEDAIREVGGEEAFARWNEALERARRDGVPIDPDDAMFAADGVQPARADRGFASVEAFEAAAREAFMPEAGDAWPQVWEALRAAAHVEVVATRSEAPLHPFAGRGVKAFYDGDYQQTFFIADRIRPGELKGLLLHEIGVHAGLERMLGRRGFNAFLAQVDRLVDEGHPDAVSAREHAEQFSASQAHVREETAAWLLTWNADLPIARSLLAKMRQWLMRTFGSTFGMRLTIADMRDLALAAMFRQGELARREGPGKWSSLEDSTALHAKYAADSDLPTDMVEGPRNDRSRDLDPEADGGPTAGSDDAGATQRSGGPDAQGGPSRPGLGSEALNPDSGWRRPAPIAPAASGGEGVTQLALYHDKLDLSDAERLARQELILPLLRDTTPMMERWAYVANDYEHPLRGFLENQRVTIEARTFSLEPPLRAHRSWDRAFDPARTHLDVEMSADWAMIHGSHTARELRGGGVGTQLYMDAIDTLHAEGRRVFSDTSLSDDAMRLYREVLPRRGYQVRQLARNLRRSELTGQLLSDKGAIFEVLPRLEQSGAVKYAADDMGALPRRAPTPGKAGTKVLTLEAMLDAAEALRDANLGDLPHAWAQTIAKDLGLAPKTVSTYVQQIKSGAHGEPLQRRLENLDRPGAAGNVAPHGTWRAAVILASEGESNRAIADVLGSTDKGVQRAVSHTRTRVRNGLAEGRTVDELAAELGLEREVVDWLGGLAERRRGPEAEMKDLIRELSLKPQGDGSFLRPQQIAERMKNMGYYEGIDLAEATERVLNRRALMRAEGVELPRFVRAYQQLDAGAQAERDAQIYARNKELAEDPQFRGNRIRTVAKEFGIGEGTVGRAVDRVKQRMREGEPQSDVRFARVPVNLGDAMNMSAADALAWHQDSVEVTYRNGAEEHRFRTRDGLQRNDVGVAFDDWGDAAHAEVTVYWRGKTSRDSEGWRGATPAEVTRAAAIFKGALLVLRVKLAQKRVASLTFAGATPAHARFYEALLRRIEADGYRVFKSERRQITRRRNNINGGDSDHTNVTFTVLRGDQEARINRLLKQDDDHQLIPWRDEIDYYGGQVESEYINPKPVEITARRGGEGRPGRDRSDAGIPAGRGDDAAGAQARGDAAVKYAAVKPGDDFNARRSASADAKAKNRAAFREASLGREAMAEDPSMVLADEFGRPTSARELAAAADAETAKVSELEPAVEAAARCGAKHGDGAPPARGSRTGDYRGGGGGGGRGPAAAGVGEMVAGNLLGLSIGGFGTAYIATQPNPIYAAPEQRRQERVAEYQRLEAERVASDARRVEQAARAELARQYASAVEARDPSIAPAPAMGEPDQDRYGLPQHIVPESERSALLDFAARFSGADRGYLASVIAHESGWDAVNTPWDPRRGQNTSSARGLGQFLDGTWNLQRLNFPGAANLSREEWFALRDDPRYAAAAAGMYAADNARILRDRLGYRPTRGQVYLAHFAGAEGALQLIRLAAAGEDNAAAHMPDAADANESVYFEDSDRSRPRSALEVIERQTGWIRDADREFSLAEWDDED